VALAERNWNVSRVRFRALIKKVSVEPSSPVRDYANTDILLRRLPYTSADSSYELSL
jgi:hypothetical protein